MGSIYLAEFSSNHVIHAGKIIYKQLQSDGYLFMVLQPFGDGAYSVVVDADFVAQYDPQCGGYYINDNGIESYMPGADFEAEYVEVREFTGYLPKV